MNLNQTEQDVFDFLITPRSAQEIMNFIGHKTPPYGILRLLQRLDLIDKIAPYEKAKSLFVQSGRPMKIDNIYIKPKAVMTVFGVRL
jgi:hypothetical protein